MKQLIKLASFLLLFIYACNNTEETAKKVPEDDLDAARNFIRAALDGEYEAGKKLLVSDSANYRYYTYFEQIHSGLPPGEKELYKRATINIHNFKHVNDSLTVIVYSNSYKQKQDTLTVLRVQGQWLVDVTPWDNRILFEEKSDSLSKKTDTLK